MLFFSPPDTMIAVLCDIDVAVASSIAELSKTKMAIAVLCDPDRERSLITKLNF